MAKKKKSQQLGSRFKRMKKSGRLESAKSWLLTYKGKNTVSGYRKRYGVDVLCAIRELNILGVVFDPEYVKAIQKSIDGAILTRKRKKLERENRKNGALENGINGIYGVDCDDNFAFIIGHTSGGAPYGVSWEDWEDFEDMEVLELMEEKLEDDQNVEASETH